VLRRSFVERSNSTVDQLRNAHGWVLTLLHPPLHVLKVRIDQLPARHRSLKRQRPSIPQRHQTLHLMVIAPRYFRLTARVGARHHLGVPGMTDWPEPHLSKWLSATPDDHEQEEFASIGQLLEPLWERQEVSERTALWGLRRLAAGRSEAPIVLAVAAVRVLGRMSSPSLESCALRPAVEDLLDRRDLIAGVRDAVLERPTAHRDLLVWLFRLLAAAKDVQHVEAIGHFIEDAGVWLRSREQTCLPSDSRA
jgi:hypothetical protein